MPKEVSMREVGSIFQRAKNSLLAGLKIGGSEEKLKGKLGIYESAFFFPRDMET
jgi:hypothetical protein